MERSVLACFTMPTEPRLDPIVDPRVPLISRVRKRAAVAAGFLLGVSGTGAFLFATLPAAEVGAPIVFRPPATITVPPPLIVTIEQAAPLVPRPAPGLACPRMSAADLPIGWSLSLARDDYDDDSEATAVAAAGGPQLAVHANGGVWVSDDDGRSFDAVFTDHEVETIAMDAKGVLYAQSGNELGVRAPRGKPTWRARTLGDCEACKSQIAVLGGEVVWIHGSEVAVTADRGRSWKNVDVSEYAWTNSGQLLAWRGALYQVELYRDMCGVDDTHVHRLDANHRIAHSIFANYYNTSGSVLVADNQTDATWSWRERCWSEDGPGRVGACATKSATRAQLLTAGTLRPVEGARTLSVWNGALVELCGNGARQVYRQFPFTQIDAVDHVGRPVVTTQRTLLRWSPVHGWRMLFTLPESENE